MKFSDITEDRDWIQDPDQDYTNPLPVIHNDNIFDTMDEVDVELINYYKDNIGPIKSADDYATAINLMYKKTGTIQDVPIKDIICIEKYLNSIHLKALTTGSTKSSSNMPIFYKDQGKFYASDGNHRIVANYLMKKTTAKGLVLDVWDIL